MAAASRQDLMPETYLELHDAADGLAAMHQVEGCVDLLQWHRVGYEVVYVYLALHIPVDDLRHVGAAPRAAAGQVDQVWDQIPLDLVRVDEVGHAELLSEVPLGRVEVDADDLVGPDHA